MSDQDIKLSCTQDENDEGKQKAIDLITTMITNFKKELKINVDPNPKIVYTAKDNAKYDIMTVGNKNFENFYQFYNKSNDDCTLFTLDNDNEWSPSQPNDSKFTIYLPKHAIRLTSFAIRMSKNEKYEKNAPSVLCLYGYNNHVKRWDVLYYIMSHPLKVGLRYDLKIENGTQNNFYNAFQFFTYSDHLSLANFRLYGDLINDKTSVDPSFFNKSVRVSYQNLPVISATIGGDGILKQAIKIFGPELLNFVYVVFESGEKKNRVSDVWKSDLDSYFKSSLIDENRPNTVSIYFPNYLIFIDGYQIQGHKDPSISNWCLGISDNYPNEGIIVDTRKNVTLQAKKIYNYDINTGDQSKVCRLVRLFGLDKEYSFSKIDFFGLALPSDKIVMDNIKIYKWPYPSIVNKHFEKKESSDDDNKTESEKDDDDSNDNESESENNDDNSDNEKVSKVRKEEEKSESSDDDNKTESEKDDDDSDDNESESENNDDNSDNEKVSKVRKEEEKSEAQKDKRTRESEKEERIREIRREEMIRKSQKEERRRERKREEMIRESQKEERRREEMRRKRRAESSSDDSDSPPAKREEKPKQQPPQSKIQQSQTKPTKPVEEKPQTQFCCKYCGSQYRTISSLTSGNCRNSPNGKHVPFSGNQTGPFYCMYCGSQYRTISSLTGGNCRNSPNGKHIPFSSSGQPSFYCKYCGSQYRTISSLTGGNCRNSKNGKHVPFKGSDQKSYYCKYCGSNYRSLSSLTGGNCRNSPNGKHVPYSGGDKKSYCCKYCGSNYRSLSSLTGGNCRNSPNGKHIPSK